MASADIDHPARFHQRRGAERRRRAHAGRANCRTARRAIRRCCAGCAASTPDRSRRRMPSRATARRFSVESLPAEEHYDLVVVGGGISGLAAAWFYRRARGAKARILILDNHDDFGGHAKRNEFMLDGRLVIGYGGSQSIDSPNAWWSDDRQGLAARARRRRAALRDRVRAQPLSVARPVARHVLRARGVRARPPGDRRFPDRAEHASAAARQRQAADRVRRGLADLRARQDAAPRPLFAGARSARRTRRRRKVEAAEEHELSRLPDQDLGLQRGSRELFPGPHPTASSGSDATRCPLYDVRDQGYPGFRGLNLPDAGGSER